MTMAWLLVIAGLALLYGGAEGLVRGSASLALRLGMTPLIVGLTVVAFGTSMPELLVSVKASLAGQGGIAVGNVVGSNVFNIAVILALGAIVRPLHVEFQLIRFDVPFMVFSGALAAFFLRDGNISRGEGAILIVLLVTYIVASIVIARRKKTPKVEADFADVVKPGPGGVFLDLVFIVGGLAVLVLGSRLLVDGAIVIARSFGVTEAVIGLTIVAAGTSTPELAATIVASIKKEADIAVGNVIGSNVFNSLFILGTAGLIHPLSADGVTMIDLGVMLAVSALALPFMWTGFVLRRWEGFVLMAIYLGYLAWLWPK